VYRLGKGRKRIISISFTAKEYLPPLQNFLTSSGVHPASHSVSTRVILQRVKRTVREANGSPPSSTAVMNWWKYMFARSVVCVMMACTGQLHIYLCGNIKKQIYATEDFPLEIIKSLMA
jgi:hypothetical protein